MEHVIIVDDELLFQAHLEKQINKFPDVHVVGKFENGLKAQQFLMANNNVSIAFVDITMPVMSGLKLALWIKENMSATRVVLISAHQDFEFAKEAIRADVYRYLCKPFRIEELSAIFEDLAQVRYQEEKKLLYSNDLEMERRSLALFHDIITCKSNYCCADWCFTFQSYDPTQLADSVLNTALGNIIRYCSDGACSVIMQDEKISHAVIIAKNERMLPDPSAFEKKTKRLLGINVQITELFKGSAEQYREYFHNRDCLNVEEVRIIELAKAYIQNNISTELSRDDVAKAVYMSSSHFSRLFKKEVGISFQDYVKQARLNKVMELLNHGCKVSEAYTAAGFSNRNYFNEVFRKEIGCSPSEYIKRSGHLGEKV